MNFSTKFLQESFLSFFQNKSHIVLPGSSPIPINDQSLLFTNAGMNQFKQYFLGLEKSPFDPITTAQRCIRAGGKHNDLEQVGFTNRHLTHFTMLGNFSFGSYFKKEAIAYAWEYLTDILKINKEKLWVTVYQNDSEAYDIWLNVIGVEKNKILKLGEKDNFWQMGDIGPCGPCTEIYYDQGFTKNELDKKSFPSDDKSDRFIEIWNLVFMQFTRLKDGSLERLQNPGVDTGMGLERLATILQKKNSVFQTDAFSHMIHFIEQQLDIKYNANNASTFHVLCDHIRTAALLISNNIFPENEGRGYVLRKIIRRGLLFSRDLSNKITFFADLIKPLIEDKNSLYYDLNEKKNTIYQVIIDESNKFFNNIDSGVSLFNTFLKKQLKNNIFSGKDAFTLYDTFGFPLEITKILTSRNNIELDIEGYENAMTEQKNRARENAKFKIQNNKIIYHGNLQTKFIGYHTFSIEDEISDIISGEEESKIVLLFKKTVFYPGGGGQISDDGWIEYNNEKYTVSKVIKLNSAIGIEIDYNPIFKVGLIVNQVINIEKRTAITLHHSAVHLLHKAINLYFKNNAIHQNGSYVSDKYFTIDMVMQESVNYDDKKKIENIINQEINKDILILEKHMKLDDAKKIGATAQFDEKYNPDEVRVIEIGSFTTDLCGGCHARNTKQLGIVFITEISSIKSGTKRFVGVAGQEAINYIQLLESAANFVKKEYSCSLENIPLTIQKQQEKEKEAAKLLELDKKNLFLWIENMLTERKKENFVFTFFPAFFKKFEKDFVSKYIKLGTHFVFLYNEKNIIYIEINPIYKEKYKNTITDLLEKADFKGKSKEIIFEGIVKKIEYIIENIKLLF